MTPPPVWAPGLAPLLKQQVNDGLVAVAGGVVQRRQARLLEAVHRRAAVQQQLHHGQLALRGGGLQQRLALLVGGVDQVRAVFDQGLDAPDLVGFGGGGGERRFRSLRSRGQAGIQGGSPAAST